LSSAVFVKRYTDPARGLAAQAHLRWLRQLDSGIRLPHLYPSIATHLVFERLSGRLPGPGDLAVLADALGQLHGSAYARELHAARLGHPFEADTGTALPAFPDGREHALAQLGRSWFGAPAAFYKDANLRNFVITPSGPAVVDFDDLTLAPFGYDLAKLVVSTAMTFGPLRRKQIEAALTTYARSVETAGGPHQPCSLPQLASYTEVHHLLTAKYLHQNGYQHAWPDVRPWPAPAAQPA
jgi:hypothetical protein